MRGQEVYFGMLLQEFHRMRPGNTKVMHLNCCERNENKLLMQTGSLRFLVLLSLQAALSVIACRMLTRLYSTPTSRWCKQKYTHLKFIYPLLWSVPNHSVEAFQCIRIMLRNTAKKHCQACLMLKNRFPNFQLGNLLTSIPDNKTYSWSNAFHVNKRNTTAFVYSKL